MYINKQKKIGLILATIHVIIVVKTILEIYGGLDDDWPMAWLIFALVDFPFSIISTLLIGIFSEILPVDLLNFFSDPIGDLYNFILPLIFYGVLGTLWYFFLPSLFTSYMRNRENHISVTDYFKKTFNKNKK